MVFSCKPEAHIPYWGHCAPLSKLSSISAPGLVSWVEAALSAQLSRGKEEWVNYTRVHCLHKTLEF